MCVCVSKTSAHIFSRKLKKIDVSSFKDAMVQFYTSVVESVLTLSITMWFGNLTTAEKMD